MPTPIAPLALAACLAVVSLPALAAETVHLYLKANGLDIKGESTQVSLGRKDSIECVFYDQKALATREAGAAMSTGRRQYEPIQIRKRIDKASPQLLKAFAESQNIDAVFKFFRPAPSGDGTTEQFYTVVIKKARIASLRQIVPDTVVPASSTLPPMEEVTFVYPAITWAYTSGDVIYEDNWSGSR